MIEAAILAHMGHEDIAEKHLGPQAAQQARDMRVTSLVDLCRAALQSDGHVAPSGREALTLLRPADDDNYYAEDTFVVQIESASVRSIKYEGHELRWLVGQSQPMFIGLVSLDESSISHYPTIHVNHAVLALHAEWVSVRFGVSDILDFQRKHPECEVEHEALRRK